MKKFVSNISLLLVCVLFLSSCDYYVGYFTDQIRDSFDRKGKIPERVQSPWLTAAETGDLFTVKEMQKTGSDVNFQDWEDETALMLASANGHYDTVAYLLTINSDIELKDDDGYNALHKAAENGYTGIVQLLLENKADIHARAESKISALILAAGNGHLETVQLLIKQGAIMSVKDADGFTTLHYAAIHGHLDVLKYLEKQGADLTARTIEEDTALILAANRGRLEVARYLAGKRVAINAQDDFGNTALIFAADLGYIEIVRILLANGADVNIKNSNGFTALNAATSNAYLKIIDMLLAKNANVNIQTKEGVTAIMYATSAGHTQIVETLLAKGAKLEFVDSNKNTALQYALKNYHPNIVSLLKKAGAKGEVSYYWDMDKYVNVASESKIKHENEYRDEDEDCSLCSSQTSHDELTCALSNGKLNEVISFIERGADVDAKSDDGRTALMLATSYNYEKTVKYLVNLSARINLSDKYGKTIFMRAAENGNLSIINLFIDRTLAINYNSVDMYGYSALDYANANGHYNVAAFLMEKGASSGSFADSGSECSLCEKGEAHTELMCALTRSRLDQALIFIEQGQDINTQGAWPNGDTALILATKRNDFGTVKYLVNRGAHTRVEDSFGKRAFHYAQKNDNFVIMKYLFNNGGAKQVDLDMALLLTASDRANKESIALYLIEKGANVNGRDRHSNVFVLSYAIDSENLRLVKNLVANGADANLETSSGKSIFGEAVDDLNLEFTRYLIINSNITQKSLDSAFDDIVDEELATHNNESPHACLEYIIKNGVDANMDYFPGVSALSAAAQRGNLATVRALITNGATLDKKNENGKTALMEAAFYGRLDTVKALVGSGANIHIRSPQGLNALDYAIRKKKEKVAAYLRGCGAKRRGE